MDPESKLLLALDVGNRTLALAQRVVHQLVQVLAPDCAPLFLTDGFREYMGSYPILVIEHSVIYLCSCAIVSQKSPDRLVTALLPVVYLACVVPATL
jgi:hypothetical protein